MNETQLTTYTNPELVLRNATSFVDSLVEKDEEGNIVSSDITKNFISRDSKGIERFSKGDALACIILGQELGLSPLISLSLGKEINPSKVYAIDKGRSMGLSALESIKLVHTIPSKGGFVIFVGVDLIARQLIKAGITFEQVQDYAPCYSYSVYDKTSKSFVPVDTDRVIVNNEVSNKFFLLDATTTQEELDKAKSEGKLILKKSISDYVTSWLFKRPGFVPYLSQFYRSEAVKAELIATYNAKNELVTSGKDNWNKYEKQMMRNRAFATGGRKIGADVLNGVYEKYSESEFVEDTPVTVLND